MGLLDGDLREVFGSVFAPLLLDAEIIRVTLTPDGQGGITETSETAPAKGMVEQYSAYERARDAIPATDVKLIVLQKDVAIAPDLSSRVTIRGQIYSIQAIEEDPAQAAWTLQGRPVIGAASNIVYLNVAVRAAASAPSAPGLTEPVSATILQIARAPAEPELAEGGETVELAATVAVTAETQARPVLSEPAAAGAILAAASPAGPQIIESASASGALVASAHVSAILMEPLPAAAPVAVSAPADPEIIGAAVEVSAPASVTASSAAEPGLTEPVAAASVSIAACQARPVLTETASAGVPVQASAQAAPHIAEPAGPGAAVIAAAPGTPVLAEPVEGVGAATARAPGVPVLAEPVAAAAIAVASAPGEPEVDEEAQPWTPDAAFGSSLLLWYDADDAGTLTLDGIYVTGWANKGSLGGALASTHGEDPRYNASWRNGRPGIYRTIAGDATRLEQSPTGLPTGNDPSTTVAVGYIDNNATTFRRIISWGSGTNGERGLFARNGHATVTWNGTFTETASGWFGNGDQIVSSEYAGSSRDVLLTADGGRYSLDWNKGSDAATADGNVLLLASTNISAQELMVLDRVLTTDEREKLHGYLAHKWNLTGLLPSGHPYKTDPPTL